MEILRVENITKRFDNFTANDNISFKIDSGTIQGLIGPNGAGKTTLLRMICNILIPDSGSIYLFGQPVNPELQSKIGYLPEERGLYSKVKVINHLIYFGRLKGLSAKDAKNNSYQWLERLGGLSWANKKVKELSKGMQQKIQFIIAMINSPDFIILDEPFSGLDPVNMELLKNIILEEQAKGKTFIFSTHIMAHAEELCNSVCMLNKGRIILNGSIADIKNQYSKDTLIIEFSDNSDINLDKYDKLEIINKTNNRLVLKIKDNTFDKKQFIEDINKEIDIIKLGIETPTLHEIFIDQCNKSINKNN